MSSLLESIAGMIGNDQIEKISAQLGTDPETTENAVGAALPALVGGLSRRAEHDDAESTFSQWDDENDDNLMDDVNQFFGSGSQESRGDGILSQIFGGKRERVEQTVGKSTGLDQGQSGMLMKMLAPIVLGALFRKKKQNNMDSGGLFDFLGKEKESTEQKSGGLIGRMLDQDGDGDFDFGDIAKVGMGMLFKK